MFRRRKKSHRNVCVIWWDFWTSLNLLILRKKFPHWLKVKMRRRSIFQATRSVRNDLYSENCLHNFMYTSLCAYFIASRSSKMNKFIFLTPFDFSQLLPPSVFLLYLILFSNCHTHSCTDERVFFLPLFLQKFTFTFSVFFFFYERRSKKDGRFMSRKKRVHS